MLLQHLLYACRKWWALIACAFAVGGGCAWWASGALRPALFKATSSVLVTLESRDRITQLPNPQLISDLQVPKFMATQVSIATSERVAREALHLISARPPDAPPLTGEEERAEQALVEWITQSVEVENPAQSGVLHISFMHPDPAAAAAIANALAQAYIDVTQRVNAQIAGTHTQLYAEKVARARETYARAVRELTAYQQKTGLLDTGEAGLGWMTTRYWSKQQVLDQERAGSAKNRASALRDPLSLGVSDLSHELAAGLVISLASERARLAQLESRFGPSHPQTLAQRNVVGQLETANRQATYALAGSYQSQAAALTQASNDINARTTRQAAQLAAERATRDRAITLIQNVKSAAKQFEEAHAMREWAMLNQLSKLASAQVLAPAYAPNGVASPRRFLLTILAGSIAVVMGMSCAFILIGRRMVTDSPSVLARVPGLTLLGRIGA